jgi:molybdopterin-guanine dinucleotide biosynthesis protein A
MSQSKKITGIILSGGKSSRMGTEKGLVKYRGKALIEYSVEALSSFCDQLVISSGNSAYSYLGFPIISDEIPNCGPIGGIYSCMNARPSDIYLVVSCDVPHINSHIFKQLLESLGEFQAVIPIDAEGKKQPLVACYSSDCFSVFQKELKEGNFKMMKLLSKLQVYYQRIHQDENVLSSNLFFNANTPEDLQE